MGVTARQSHFTRHGGRKDTAFPRVGRQFCPECLRNVLYSGEGSCFFQCISTCPADLQDVSYTCKSEPGLPRGKPHEEPLDSLLLFMRAVEAELVQEVTEDRQVGVQKFLDWLQQAQPPALRCL